MQRIAKNTSLTQLTLDSFKFIESPPLHFLIYPSLPTISRHLLAQHTQKLLLLSVFLIMQQAIPYKSWLPLYTNNKPLISPSQFIAHHSNGGVVATPEVLKGSRNMSKMVQENAIIVFARRGCCMSHVAKRLLLGLGVNPAVYEIDEADEICVLEELEMICNDGGKGSKKKVQFPALFIGGKLFGGLDRLMATHISGELIPILKEAGALWL